MTSYEFVQFWNEHHTPISLIFGVFITFIVFKIPNLRNRWKILIVFFSMLFLTGIMGVLKYFGLVFIILFILFGGFWATWFVGLMVLSWFSVKYSWNLKIWQISLIGAIWLPLSMVVDFVLRGIMIGMITVLNILPNKVSLMIKKRRRPNKDFNREEFYVQGAYLWRIASPILIGLFYLAMIIGWFLLGFKWWLITLVTLYLLIGLAQYYFVWVPSAAIYDRIIDFGESLYIVFVSPFFTISAPIIFLFTIIRMFFR